MHTESMPIPTGDLDVSIAPKSWPTPARGEHAAEDRQTLGLPTDQPVIMSGHQSELFHAGIAARLAALLAWSERTGAHPSWLVVDQEPGDPLSLRVPEHGTAVLSSRHQAPTNVPTGLQPAATIDHAGGLPGLSDALVDRLRSYADAPSLALQVTRATLDVLVPALGFDEAPSIVCATDLYATRAMAWHVNVCRDDPAGVHERYNAANAATPDAGVRTLLSYNDDAVELPLWRVRDNGPRLPVISRTHLDDDTLLLLPRALGMTAIARHALCDAFIHGAGGLGYEPINDAGWHGLRGLAPVVGITGTLLLDPDAGPAPDPTRLAWAAHHARHHPELAGDDKAQHERDALVVEIRNLPRGSGERADAYGRLQSMLRAHRDRHGDALALLRERAQASVREAELHAERVARDWPWCTHSADRVRALGDRARQAVDRAIGANA